MTLPELGSDAVGPAGSSAPVSRWPSVLDIPPQVRDRGFVGRGLVGGENYYYLVDQLGSVLTVTDKNAAVRQRYAYEPYGQKMDPGEGFVTNPIVNSPLRFAGEYYDTSTQLYKIGNRYYDPEIGRWTQRDPLRQPFDLVNNNPYVYAGANPLNHRDPSGTLSTQQVFEGARVVWGYGGLVCYVYSAWTDTEDSIDDEIHDLGSCFNPFNVITTDLGLPF